MKFGFGAQIVVGLPVVGNVSVLYMVGVEIHTDVNSLTISAFLLFQGHAELLGGLVSVTITIEAKGSVRAIGPDPGVRGPSNVCHRHQYLPGHRHRLQQIMGRAAPNRLTSIPN